MKLNFFTVKVLSLLALSSFLLSSCQVLGSEESPCERIIGDTYQLVSVNGESLPYTSYYIDAENKSLVTGGRISFKEDTWNSVLINEKTMNGTTTTENITRQGPYTCSDATAHLANDENGAAGTAGKIDDDTFILGADSGFTYVFEK